MATLLALLSLRLVKGCVTLYPTGKSGTMKPEQYTCTNTSTRVASCATPRYPPVGLYTLLGALCAEANTRMFCRAKFRDLARENFSDEGLVARTWMKLLFHRMPASGTWALLMGGNNPTNYTTLLEFNRQVELQR